MKTLSKQRLKRVETAIERARRVGQAVYVEGGEPACVIAQLGALEKVPVERMATWTGSVVSLGIHAPELRAYPRFLLDRLQLTWDDPFRTAEEARERLRDRLRRWMDGDRGSSEDEWR